ncbi:hypothetical protein PG993_005281 [Apiospora rasikravindrae]|uniref:Uncharacterized protein n=1 Tax=Apiospora rasikravindrae TaxID=990691 RepID=A0ABR1TF66_9PEZI
MRRWLQVQGILGRAFCQTRRSLSTVTPAPNNIERVKVKCGSSGSIHVDLHNLAKVTSSDPLMIYLPPFGNGHSGHLSQVPAFFRKYLTAVINYRWAGSGPVSGLEADEGSDSPSHLRWPMPIHDTLRGYSWILENLTPLTSARREVYVFGSYLGASLATSLALTENHPHERTRIRGFAAYNGIYNWTMFLPDHPIHKLPKIRSYNILEDILGQTVDPVFQEMKHQTETLFTNPSHLFDPFVSPCLFFHTPGLLVPPDFHSTAETRASSPRHLDETVDEAEEILAALIEASPEKAQRRSPLVFPPRKSTLKIPECLILHSTAPTPVSPHWRNSKRPKNIRVSNHFRTQSQELAALMRRSLEKVEFKERMKWDDSFGGFGAFEENADRRVGLRDVGFERSAFEMPDDAQAAIGEWLENRTTIDPRDQVEHLVDPENFWGLH